jgi:hypothetical protein
MTMDKLIEAVGGWANRKQEASLMRRFGGIQQCCWCRQTANQNDTWSIKQWERDPFLDVLTCGVCGGTSLWRWEIGMIWIGPLDVPASAWPADPRYDIESAALRPLQAEGRK